MLRKIILIITAALCIARPVEPALALYSGITDTVENVIQLLAKQEEQSLNMQISRNVCSGSDALNVCSDSDAFNVCTDIDSGH